VFERHAGTLAPHLQRQLTNSSGDKAHNEVIAGLFLCAG
jgi:hypothetical protein